MIVYLNGSFIPLEKATVSVMDRGFMFGDGVYEAISVLDGKLLGLEKHLSRLEHSLHALFMEMPFSKPHFEEIFKELLNKNSSTGHQVIYLQITRGVPSKRSYVLEEDIPPTIFMMVNPSPSHLEYREGGIKVLLKEDVRWKRCDIKTLSRIANILYAYQAKQAGVDDVIIKSNDEILEGPSSNVFIVKDGVIYTPEISHNLLQGVTRGLIIKKANELEIPCLEKVISVDELMNADEVWLTSSTRKITPVIEVDAHPINKGVVGSIFKKMIRSYNREPQE